MNWLGRLKEISTNTKTDATKPTKPIDDLEIGGFVGFVAPTLTHIEKIKGDPGAANDPATNAETSVRTDLVRSEVRTESTKVRTKVRTESAELRTESGLAVDTDDPDYCCWPRSTAMTGSEIDTFTARLSRFTDKGLTLDDGESLADKLVIRDRESDDRRLCLECAHLGGHGASSWRCGNWQMANVAHRARDAQLPAGLVRKLQRCDGFATATPIEAPNSTAKTPF